MWNRDIFLKTSNLLRHFFLSLDATISSLKMQLYCNAIDIKIGRNSIFYGMATFKRTKNSKIIIGENCRFRSRTTSNLIGINHRCIIATHSETATIKIGDNCGFSGTVIGAFTSISFGHNVRCGANTLITDSDWHTTDTRVGPSKPIVIGNNVWLGYGAIVMKGVTIGENTIIGTGSIVTKDIPANVIAAGNPCRIIKMIGNQDMNALHD